MLILIAVCAMLWLTQRRGLKTTLRARASIMRFDEREAITDINLLKKCGFVFALVLLGFFAGHPLHIEPGTVALSGAALLMMLAYGRQPADNKAKTCITPLPKSSGLPSFSSWGCSSSSARSSTAACWK